MASRWIRWFRGLLVLVVVVLVADWGYSTVRLHGVRMDVALNPPRVLADGKHKTVLTIRVSEDGHPRAHDLLTDLVDLRRRHLAAAMGLYEW